VIGKFSDPDTLDWLSEILTSRKITIDTDNAIILNNNLIPDSRNWKKPILTLRTDDKNYELRKQKPYHLIIPINYLIRWILLVLLIYYMEPNSDTTQIRSTSRTVSDITTILEQSGILAFYI